MTQMEKPVPDLHYNSDTTQWIYTVTCACGHGYKIAREDFPFRCPCGARSDIDRTGT